MGLFCCGRNRDSGQNENESPYMPRQSTQRQNSRVDELTPNPEELAHVTRNNDLQFGFSSTDDNVEHTAYLGHTSRTHQPQVINDRGRDWTDEYTSMERNRFAVDRMKKLYVDKIDKLQVEKSDMKSKLQATAKKYDDMERLNDSLIQKINALKGQLYQVERNAECSIKTLERHIKQLEKDNSDLQYKMHISKVFIIEYNALQLQLRRSFNELDEYKTKLHKCQDDLQSERGKYASYLEHESKLVNLEHEKYNLEANNAELVNENIQMNSELFELKQKIEQEQNARKLKLGQENGKLRLELAEMKQVLNETRQKYTALEDEVLGNQQHEAHTKRCIDELLAENGNLKRDIDQQKTTITNQRRESNNHIQQIRTCEMELANSNNKLQALAECEQKVRKENMSLCAQLSEVEQTQSCEIELKNSIVKLRQCKEDTTQLQKENSQLKADNTLLQKDISQLKANTTHLQSENSQLMTDFTQLQKENNPLKADNTLLQKENSQMKTDTTQLQKVNDQLKAEITQLQRGDNSLKTDTIHLQRENSQLKAQGTQLQRENYQLKTDITRLRDDNSQSKADTIQFQKDNSQLKTYITQLQKENSQLKADNTLLQKEYSHASDQIKKHSEEYAAMQNKLHQTQSLLKQMERELEGSKTMLQKDKLISQSKIERLLQEKHDLEECNVDLEKINLQMKTDINNLQRRLESDQTARYSLAEYDALQHKLRRTEKDLKEAEIELEDTKTRLSKSMGDKLTNNNPNIVDLSDMNRPSKLADRYKELYDNQWTDAYEVLETTETDEYQIIYILLTVFIETKRFCDEQTRKQMKDIMKAITHSNEVQIKAIPVGVLKYIKDCRKSSAAQSIKIEYEKYTRYLMEGSIPIAKQALMINEYLQECFELCWLMAIQDPPVVLGSLLNHGDSFRTDLYSAYTVSGKIVDFVVWPALLLHDNGPTLTKGVAQGMKKA